MPDGELLRLGSLATGDDPFWGESPGPDLRGLLRGYTGLRGCLGIVTRMAIKTLPFQPERLEPTGISPNTALALPEKRVKWINFVVPSKEAQVEAMREIGHAEIGGAVTKVPLFLAGHCQGRVQRGFLGHLEQGKRRKRGQFLHREGTSHRLHFGRADGVR